MRNEFLRELDHWVLAVLHEKLVTHAPDRMESRLGETEFALMIADYVLLRLADNPDSCWSACQIDGATDDQIRGATTFSGDVLAAAFLGAAADLAQWQGDDGYRFMVENGVPADDAQAIATAVEVVATKLGTRGRAIIQPQPHVMVTELVS